MSEQEEIAIERAEKQAQEAKEIMDKLANYVNYGKSKKAFIEAFKREHRTLQQSMFRMFMELIEDMATGEYHTDARNEASKNMAKTLIKGFKEIKKQEYINEGTSEKRAEEYVSGLGSQPSRYLPFI